MAGPGLTPCDLRMLDDALSFVVRRQKDLNKILHQVEDMDSFTFWWYSNFMSFKTSDREAIERKIHKYKNLHIDMEDVIRLFLKGTEDVDELIMELYDILAKMRFEAESKVDSTDSNAIRFLRHLRMEYEENYQLLENKVKNLEVAALRQQLNKARYDLKEIQAALDQMRQEQQLVQENTVTKTQLEDLLRRQ